MGRKSGNKIAFRVYSLLVKKNATLNKCFIKALVSVNC